jgi:hypothetical protein
VPVLQLSLSSDRMNEQLYDYGIYRLRQALAPSRASLSVPLWRQIPPDHGRSTPRPSGQRHHPDDVVNAVNAQSLTLPSGDAKMGDWQYIVAIDTHHADLVSLDQVPIQLVGPTRSACAPRGPCARRPANSRTSCADGRRAVLLPIIKPATPDPGW